MSNRDYLVNVITLTEDDGSYTADMSYSQINRDFARGTGSVVLYDGMLIPLIAVDHGFYFGAEILGKYTLVVIDKDGVEVTVSESGQGDGTTPDDGAQDGAQDGGGGES